MTSTSQPDAAPITSQIQAALTSLLSGPEASQIKPGHYIVVVDTKLVPESTWEVLQDLQAALSTVGIHLHLLPTDAPQGLTFIEVAPALAQFAPEVPAGGSAARG